MRIPHGTGCAVMDDPDGIWDENGLWPISVGYVPGATEALLGGIPRATVRAGSRAQAATPDYVIVRATDLGQRMKDVVDPDTDWDADCQLLDGPSRATMCLLLHPSLLPAVFAGTSHRPPGPDAQPWQIRDAREWWDDILADAVDAGADPTVAARRAAIFSTEQTETVFERILADLASWDSLPDTVTPEHATEAINAGLSADETASVLGTPDGQARIATLAALRAATHGNHPLRG